MSGPLSGKKSTILWVIHSRVNISMTNEAWISKYIRLISQDKNYLEKRGCMAVTYYISFFQESRLNSCESQSLISISNKLEQGRIERKACNLCTWKHKNLCFLHFQLHSLNKYNHHSSQTYIVCQLMSFSDIISEPSRHWVTNCWNYLSTGLRRYIFLTLLVNLYLFYIQMKENTVRMPQQFH